MYRSRPTPVLILASALILTSACNTAPAPPKSEEPPKASLDAQGLMVVPLADGSAYANDVTGAIWYIRGDTGIRVKGLPEEIDVAEIVPTVDGGAYVTSSAGLWYVHEDRALKVREGSPAKASANVLSAREKWLWAGLHVERQRRLQSGAHLRYDQDYRNDDDSRDPDRHRGVPR